LGLTIERQLGKNWLIRGAYMGNEGSHLSGDGDEEQGEQQVNPAIYIPGQSTTANTQARRIYQNFGPIGLVTSATISNYSALAITAESRSSHGLTPLAS